MVLSNTLGIFPSMEITRDYLLQMLEAKRAALNVSRRKLAELIGIKYQALNDFFYGKSQMLGGMNLVSTLSFLDIEQANQSEIYLPDFWDKSDLKILVD